MKHVLIISQWETPWGVGKGVGVPERYQLIKRWASEGYEVHVVSATIKKGMEDQREDCYYQHYFRVPFFQYGVRNIRLNPSSNANFAIHKICSICDILLFTIFAVIKSLMVIRSKDVVLVYSFGEFGVLASRLIARLRAVPFVTRLYGTILYRAFKAVEDLSLWKRVLYVPLVNHLAFRVRSDYIIVTDDDCKADLLPEFMDIYSPMALIRNGVDRSSFLSVESKEINLVKQQYALDQFDLIIGNIGRFSERKRNHLLLKALPQVLSALRDLRVGIVLIGGGESLDKYKDIIKQNGLNPYVKILGPVPRDEVPIFFHCIDIYYSALVQMNLCFAFVEAMVTGRCVLTSDELRENEFVINNKTVVMVHEADDEEKLVNSIAEKIVFLIRNEEFRRTIAKNAELYAERFVSTVNEAVEKEFKIAKSLIKDDGL